MLAFDMSNPEYPVLIKMTSGYDLEPYELAQNAFINGTNREGGSNDGVTTIQGCSADTVYPVWNFRLFTFNFNDQQVDDEED